MSLYVYIYIYIYILFFFFLLGGRRLRVTGKYSCFWINLLH